MKKLIFAASLLGALMVTEIAGAQPARFNKQRQEARIEQGVRHHKLTRAEARHLKAQQHRIKAMKKMAMADGIVTPRERMMIRNAQKRAGVAIYKQKHDRDFRWHR